MAYLYERFGATYASGEVLPLFDGTEPMGAGPVANPIMHLPGGGFWDVLQSGIGRQGSRPLTLKGDWIAASAAAMDTKIDALNALVGKRSYLWKSNDGGTTTRFILARCLAVRTPTGPGSALMSAVEMDFELAAGPWSGAAHAEETVLTTGSDNIVTTNGGNARVRDAIITIRANASPITTVDFYKANLVHWYWQGTLGSGTFLIINCGTKRVTNNGVDAYAGFHLHAQHADSDWLPIDPGGAVTFVVTRTGGNLYSTCNLVYADGWN